MLAVAIAVILGAVFYGLNNTPVHQAGTSSTAQNTAPETPIVAPPGMRDVTPRSNMQPGMTTGAAPANPKAPPGTDTSGAAKTTKPNKGSGVADRRAIDAMSMPGRAPRREPRVSRTSCSV